MLAPVRADVGAAIAALKFLPCTGVASVGEEFAQPLNDPKTTSSTPVDASDSDIIDVAMRSSKETDGPDLRFKGWVELRESVRTAC